MGSPPWSSYPSSLAAETIEKLVGRVPEGVVFTREDARVVLVEKYPCLRQGLGQGIPQPELPLVPSWLSPSIPGMLLDVLALGIKSMYRDNAESRHERLCH